MILRIDGNQIWFGGYLVATLNTEVSPTKMNEFLYYIQQRSNGDQPSQFDTQLTGKQQSG